MQKYTNTNIAALQKIQIIPIGDVDLVKVDIMNLTAQVTLKTGCSFIDIYFSPGTGALESKASDTENGPVFNVLISANHPKLSLDKSLDIFAFLEQRFIVKVTDMNANTFIIGNIDNPAKLSFDQVIPSSLGEYTGYHISMTGIFAYPLLHSVV
jgi:hypothetical protein